MSEDGDDEEVDIRQIREEIRSMREDLRREIKEEIRRLSFGQAREAETEEGSDAEGEAGIEAQTERTEHYTSPRLILTKSDDGKKVIIDVGSMGEMVEEMVNGIKGEIQKSILIGRDRIMVSHGDRGKKERIDEEASAKVFAALGNEHRVRILKELSTGGMYANELEEKMPISASTLSSHLSVLEESGLVIQEAVRGRYLITLRGRRALKVAKGFSGGS